SQLRERRWLRYGLQDRTVASCGPCHPNGVAPDDTATCTCTDPGGLIYERNDTASLAGSAEAHRSSPKNRGYLRGGRGAIFGGSRFCVPSSPSAKSQMLAPPETRPHPDAQRMGGPPWHASDLQRRPLVLSVLGASPDFSPRLGEGRSPATGRAYCAGASSSFLRSPQAVLAVGDPNLRGKIR